MYYRLVRYPTRCLHPLGTLELMLRPTPSRKFRFWNPSSRTSYKRLGFVYNRRDWQDRKTDMCSHGPRDQYASTGLTLNLRSSTQFPSPCFIILIHTNGMNIRSRPRTKLLRCLSLVWLVISMSTVVLTKCGSSITRLWLQENRGCTTRTRQ